MNRDTICQLQGFFSAGVFLAICLLPVRMLVPDISTVNGWMLALGLPIMGGLAAAVTLLLNQVLPMAVMFAMGATGYVLSFWAVIAITAG